MPKVIYSYYAKKRTRKNKIATIVFSVLILCLGVFGGAKIIKAQAPSTFSIINTQFSQLNTGNHKTNTNNGSFLLGGSGKINNFIWQWNNLSTIFYDEGDTRQTIYFNNFDSPEVLNQNQAPLADSIRDFTGGNNGIGQNGWSYKYKWKTSVAVTVNGRFDEELNPCTPTGPTCNGGTIINRYSSTNDDSNYECEIGGIDCTKELEPVGPLIWHPGSSAYAIEIGGATYNCVEIGPGTLVPDTCQLRNKTTGADNTNIAGMSFSSINKLRTIQTDPIINYGFANIGENTSHPGSGTINNSGYNNIPIIQQRTSPITGKIKIINKLADDDNNCGNGINYQIYSGKIIGGSLTGIKEIVGYKNLVNNFTQFTIEKEITVNEGDNIFFEIDNNGNNECDGTYNHIQIFDVTTNTAIAGSPTYTSNGKYKGALDFKGNDLFSLGTGVNQGNGITIGARIYTRDNTKKQGIITKNDSYGIVLMSGTIRVAPSTYWMWHDTGIPVTNNTRTHITWTYDGATMNAYKNGGEQHRSYNINGTLSQNKNLTYIGYDNRNQWGRDGLIDEVRIYNKGYSPEQVKELYESNLELPIKTNNAWKFTSNKSLLSDKEYSYNINGGKIVEELGKYVYSSVPVCSSSEKSTCDIGRYSSEIDQYYYPNQCLTKVRINDGNGFYGKLCKTEPITGSLLIDTKGPSLQSITGLSVNESQQLVVTGIWFDTGMNSYIETGFDRGYGRDINGPRDIGENTGNIINFGVKDEPTIQQIKIRIKDHLGNQTFLTGTIEWKNIGPTIINTKDSYTGYVEKDITFIANTIDTGNTVSYQRYKENNCIYANRLGSTSTTFSTGSETTNSLFFSYAATDSQGLVTCKNLTGKRIEPIFNSSEYTASENKSIDLNGGSNGQIDTSSSAVLQQGTIGSCSIGNTNIQYIGTGIGNDFCIIQSGSKQIVLGWYNANIYSTLFKTTGTKGILRGQDYILTDTSSPLQIEIQNKNLTSFERSLSGINVPTKFNSQIYNNELIGLYNFDKILLSDSTTDFSSIQSGKNRSYLRRPRGTNTYEPLQYLAASKQRIISNPVQTFDGLFIEKNQINPGDNYGDAVIGRTSPVNANIEIQYTLEDENTTCGDGIRYKLKKDGILLATGNFESEIKKTKIKKGESLFFEINSIDNNSCDTTKYAIKIYQLPESDISINGLNQGTNSGATYVFDGKYNGAFEFTDNNQSINIGTGVWSSNMSISARLYKTTDETRQTIIQKRGSYGIVLFNNTLQVTNKTDNKRYDTKITLPNNERTHLGRSYDGQEMKVYINGKEERKTTIIGSVANTNYTTQIGYSFSNGQRKGKIDEIYIYSTGISEEGFATLYEHNLNRIKADKWLWKSNLNGSIYDGKFMFTNKINNNLETNGSFIRDFNGPDITSIYGFTGKESEPLNIKTTWYDSGTNTNPAYGFDWDINGDGTFEYTNTGKNVIIPAENEPQNKIIKIRIKDSFDHTTISPITIIRSNEAPIINEQEATYKSKINGNISFKADAVDTGTTLSYQWYSGFACDEKINGAMQENLIIKKIVTGTGLYSYRATDEQNLTSICGGLTGVRSEGIFMNYTKNLIGDGAGGIITGSRADLLGATGGKIITQGKKGTCEIAGSSNNEIRYTPFSGEKGNDSCIIEVNDQDKTNIVIAITNINNETNISRSGDLATTGILTESNTLMSSAIIKARDILSFTGTVDLTSNILHMYNFDTTVLTDSEKDFGVFQGEGGWKYYQESTGTENLLQYNAKTSTRIIDEPQQDFEYVSLNKNTAYPGSTKYGDIIYERTSNFSGTITSNTILSDADTQCGDGISFSIKTKNDTLYTNSYANNFGPQTINTTTNILPGEKLYFIINSKDNNACDKITFKTKISTQANNSVFNRFSPINIQGSPIYDNGKNGGGYTFTNNNQYFNLGKINAINKTTKQPTFSMWLKTNDNNGTIVYKEGSYGLIVKDSKIQVTTDGYRRYSTTITTNMLQNRTHLTWTYNGTIMNIFLNGQESRSGNINGYYPINNNSTRIGRDSEYGQLEGSIDELRVYDKQLTGDAIVKNYQTSLLKINAEERNFILNQPLLPDGINGFTGYINNNLITGTKTIDVNAPVIGFIGLTGEENTGILVTLSGFDAGTSISGYSYRYKIPENALLWKSWTTTGRNIINDNKIFIEKQKEPTTGILELEIRDASNHKKTYTTPVNRTNVAITTNNIVKTGYENQEITLTASGFDPGDTISTRYQRYKGNSCTTPIIGAIENTFTTGNNEPGTSVFSYNMRDAQDMTGNCSTATIIRENIAPTAKDLSLNNNGNTEIVFTGEMQDPGNSIFSGARYAGGNCEGTPIAIGTTLTAINKQITTKTFSYKIRDLQGAAAKNNINTGRDCQIATGYWTSFNPQAIDFSISNNTENKTVTGNRRTLSEARDLETNTATTINATLVNTEKGYCRITSDIISFQPSFNQTGDGYCLIRLSDNNNGIRNIKAYAKSIDTAPPVTNVTENNSSIQLVAQDTASTDTYYKILNGIRPNSACGIDGYTKYTNSISIPTVTGISSSKTLCYYSKDIYGNQENYNVKVYSPDTTQLNVSFVSNSFMKNAFEATITTNKACSGTLTGIDGVQSLNYATAGTYTINVPFTDTNGNKTAYIILTTQNSSEGTFTRVHDFTIDQMAPSIPIIIENSQNNDYFVIKRNPIIDQGAGIQGYNYKITNENNLIVKNGTTEATYLNISKQEFQNNKQIIINVQSKDKANNVSDRSAPISFTITASTTIDNQPDQFSFSKTTNAKRGNTYTSNEIIIKGLSENIKIPISLSNGTLFINNNKTTNNSGTVKNGDIVYIELNSSDNYSDVTQAALIANGISATYTITTESKSSSSTTSFLDQIKKLLEQVNNDETADSSDTNTNTDSTIDTRRISAPYKAPNGKTYKLYKTKEGKYGSYNFIYKKVFSTLTELKSYINKNNPKK